MDEAKKVALREAVALHAPHTGASDDDVVATAERLYQWLRNGSAEVLDPGKPIWEWPVTREATGNGNGTTHVDDTMDWPLVT
jgi:hypothetical protein